MICWMEKERKIKILGKGDWAGCKKTSNKAKIEETKKKQQKKKKKKTQEKKKQRQQTLKSEVSCKRSRCQSI